MQDNLNILWNGRQPQFFLLSNWKRPTFFSLQIGKLELEEIWKTTSMFLKIEDNLNFLFQIEELELEKITSICLKMEDNLNILLNWRRPQMEDYLIEF